MPVHGGRGKGAGVGLGVLRKRRKGGGSVGWGRVPTGGAGGGVWAAGNGRAWRKRASIGRHASRRWRAGGPVGWALPRRERKACGPCLEHVGRPRRRKTGRARGNKRVFDLFE
jgi:hypothetical protein